MNATSLNILHRAICLGEAGQGTCLSVPSSASVVLTRNVRKTTTMAFKMFGIERMARNQADIFRTRPRQLFVTQSGVLAKRVRDYYAKLYRFLSLATGDYHALMYERGDAQGGRTFDDGDEWLAYLPKKFSDLQDIHFPLFLTFDKARLMTG